MHEGVASCADIDKAARLGLTAVALTDHNTTAGLSEFMLACEKQGIKGVPGVELSTEYKGTEFHILALFLKKENYDEIKVRLPKGKKDTLRQLATQHNITDPKGKISMARLMVEAVEQVYGVDLSKPE